jgi:hypothetical protein
MSHVFAICAMQADLVGMHAAPVAGFTILLRFAALSRRRCRRTIHYFAEICWAVAPPLPSHGALFC